MNRDGNNTSLWQNMNSFVPATLPNAAEEYDVVIVGGGITGIVTAWTLQKAGKKCLLAESNNLGFGTTSGTTAHLNTLLDTPYATITQNFGIEGSRVVAAAASLALHQVEKNVEQYNIDCQFERTPAFLFAQTKKETEDLREIFAATVAAGVYAEPDDALPIPVQHNLVIRFDEQAKFHPTKYLFALAVEFEKLGGHILEQCRVNHADKKNEVLHIETTRGTIKANTIVYATHIPPGINLLHLRCAPWRSYAMAVKLKDDQYPKGLIYDMEDPYHYYRSHRVGDEAYLIAGGKDHKTGTGDNTEKQFLSLQAHIQKIFNVEAVKYQWSSQYFESTDGLPYIGLLPGHADSVYVATGFGGNGMIYSHVAAKEISNLILTGTSFFNNLFSPARIKPIAGFSNFVEHNADVIKHFVGGYFGIHQLEEFAQLSPGEGKIVSIEGTQMALSKDDVGHIHAVSPSCTHMRCNVTWNGTERSWDCPCHGARYSPDGKVITGPATNDLQQIDIFKLAESTNER